METALGRRLWIIVIGALILTGVLVFISGRGATARVAIVDVTRQNLSSIVSSNGKVEPITPISFRAGFSTFVEKVSAAEGQQVKRGQRLFILDDSAVQADLDHARAELSAQQEALRAAKTGGPADQSAKINSDLQKSQARRDQLQRDNEALVKLVAQKAATPQELDQNRVALAQAESDVKALSKAKESFEHQVQLDTQRIALLVDQAQNQVRDLQGQIASAHPIVPVNATLYSFPIHQGDFVKAGDLLAEMADLHQVRVRAFIDEPELGQIDVNQVVEITWDAHPDRMWEGRTEVLPKQVVAHGTRNVGELLCSVSNDKLDLLPNVTVDVRIHVGERPNVLVVPRGAVYLDGNKRYVFLANGDRLRRADITVGIANPTMIEVISGLHEGDVVALPGETQLKQNLRISPVREE
jgi:HlyD family secretion protein